MNPDDQSPILCRLAGSLPALDIAGADQVPTDIQWMPPGKHTITAMKSGKPVTLAVLVDAKGSGRMQTVLDDYQAAAAAREGDVPYLDFNHAEAESAGSVAEFSWGGDDPVTGGIRARIDWSGPGRAALAGKAYRRFSPSFFVDAEGRVKGAPLVMGGLVNQAAFKTIAPIVSRDGRGSQETSTSTMNEQELAALQAAAAAKDAEITVLKAKLVSAESDQAVKAKDAEIASLKAEIGKLKEQVAVQAKDAAKVMVDAAIKAGKLPPQATELHAKWVEALTGNPTAASMLDSIAPNPALAGALTAGKAADAGKVPQGFAGLVQAKTAAGMKQGDAVQAAVAENPEAYKAFRASGDKL